MNALLTDTRYVFYTLAHPFNGFYELRFHRRKNWVLIGLLYLLYGAVQIFKTYYAGMLVGTDAYGTNNLQVFAFSLFPFLLFALSNWSVTTLFDGNGSMGDVLMVMAYALFPKILTDIVYTVLSNVVVSEELVILNVIGGFGLVLFCFLTFCGLCVVHEYLPAKNILTILAPAAAALVILFIGMLYLQIMSKLVGFVSTVVLELANRR